MKVLLTTILILFGSTLNSQTLPEKIDSRTQLEKEDAQDIYNQESITKLDLIQALDVASIKIHKFEIGEFDKKYKFQIFADKYKNSQLIETDTLLDYHNEYVYFIGEDLNLNFIDQIKFFSKSDDNKSELTIQTYALSTKEKIELEKLRENQFYQWREFTKTKWKLDEKIPLMIFASSWFDEQINLDRFCGVVKLSQNEADTNELLTFSPNYVIINYKISQL